MPNDVYATARRELASMMSVRAAERVLDDALASASVAADEVTPRQMRALVVGPIQRHLRATFPPAGVKAALTTLTERLRAMGAPTPVAEPARDDAPARAAEGAAHADRVEAKPVSRPAPVSAATSASPAASSVPASAGAAVASPRHAGPPLEELQRTALAFARHDDVVGVYLVRDGRVSFARGAGIDGDAAARLVPVAANLLNRVGGWRSCSVQHERGHVFVIPFGRDHLVLVGRTEFNLGAILSALASLEEAL